MPYFITKLPGNIFLLSSFVTLDAISIKLGWTYVIQSLMSFTLNGLKLSPSTDQLLPLIFQENVNSFPVS